MKALLVTLGLLLSTNVMATPETAHDKTITQIRAYENMALIYFTSHFENSQGCPSASHGTFQLSNLASDGAKNMFSLLKSAAESGKLVSMSVDGCAGQFPKIYRVDVKY